MIVLPDAENRTIVSSLVWTKHRNVTDRQTDRQNRSGYNSGLHCEQCGHAVKMVAQPVSTKEDPSVMTAMRGRKRQGSTTHVGPPDRMRGMPIANLVRLAGNGSMYQQSFVDSPTLDKQV